MHKPKTAIAITAILVGAASLASTAYACSKQDVQHCQSRYYNCVHPIDFDNDPNATRKLKECSDSKQRCLEANGCN